MGLEYLCAITDIDDPGSRSFTLGEGQQQRHVFIIKKNNQIFVYRNACPHTGAMLNWDNDTFLNFDKSRIQCSLHGAQFIIETGYCTYGPCVNNKLSKLDFTVKEDEIYLLSENL